MAKSTDTETAPKFAITRHRADDRPGKYDAEVQALIEADNTLTADDISDGIFNSLTILIPAPTVKEKEGEEVEVDNVPRYKRYVQESAKRYGKTAREVAIESNDDGTFSYEFRLTEAVKRPRKPKGDEEATEAEAA